MITLNGARFGLSMLSYLSERAPLPDHYMNVPAGVPGGGKESSRPNFKSGNQVSSEVGPIAKGAAQEAGKVATKLGGIADKAAEKLTQNKMGAWLSKMHGR
jgi:hypothetical protein